MNKYKTILRSQHKSIVEGSLCWVLEFNYSWRIASVYRSEEESSFHKNERLLNESVSSAEFDRVFVQLPSSRHPRSPPLWLQYLLAGIAQRTIVFTFVYNHLKQWLIRITWLKLVAVVTDTLLSSHPLIYLFPVIQPKQHPKVRRRWQITQNNNRLITLFSLPI